MPSHHQPQTHQDLARELHLERAELIDQISRARTLLKRANIYVEGVIARDQLTMRDPDYSHPAQSVRDDITAFLAEGLFGKSDEGETR